MPPKAPTQHPHDPRLAAVAAADGSIDPAAVEALLSRHPSTLTISELEAMQVVFDEVQYWPNNPVAHLTFTQDWLEAFHRVIGGTVTREKVRHGEVVQRSVQHHRGRADVQTYRARHVSTSRVVGHVTPRTRERRPAATRRPSSSSTTSSSDPGDSAGDGEPPAGCEHCGPREVCWSTAARAWLCLDCAEPFLQIGVGTWAHEDVADGDLGGGVAR